MRIALDAMGGDNAPAVTVKGALEAAEDYDVEVILVGDEQTINGELTKHNAEKSNISIVHASEVVKVGEFPVAASKRKNTSIAKEAYKILKGTHLNFVGNIEGKDIFNGDVDVVVCDGFTGNVSMKIVEGLAEALFSLLEKGEKATLIETIKRKFDYSEYGGAPLLGINGACIISHGRSSKNAIKNAIHLASEFVSLEVNHSIQEEIQRYGPFYRLRRGLAKD